MGRYCAGLCCTREAGIGSAGVAVGHGRGGARGARQGKGETRWTPGALAIVHRLVMVVKLCPSSASGREVPQRALRDGPIAGRRATASFWGRCSPVPVPAQRGGHSSERSASAWGGPIHPRIVRYHSTRLGLASAVLPQRYKNGLSRNSSRHSARQHNHCTPLAAACCRRFAHVLSEHSLLSGLVSCARIAQHTAQDGIARHHPPSPSAATRPQAFGGETTTLQLATPPLSIHKA